MKRALVAAALFVAVVYLKLCLPGFGEDFMPMLQNCLAFEQVYIPLPTEVTAWMDSL